MERYSAKFVLYKYPFALALVLVAIERVEAKIGYSFHQMTPQNGEPRVGLE